MLANRVVDEQCVAPPIDQLTVDHALYDFGTYDIPIFVCVNMTGMYLCYMLYDNEDEYTNTYLVVQTSYQTVLDIERNAMPLYDALAHPNRWIIRKYLKDEYLKDEYLKAYRAKPLCEMDPMDYPKQGTYLWPPE